MKETKKIIAPVNGHAISLSEISDPVFSNKVLGDGMAIIPSDGKIVSPVDGRIVTIADGKHAYGFLTEDEVNVVVHVGLESVTLKGEGFKVLAKAGDVVKAGDLIAEVDLELLKSKGIKTVTPVIVLGDHQENIHMVVSGADTVAAGVTEVIALA